MRLDEKKMATHYYVSYNIVLNKFVWFHNNFATSSPDSTAPCKV